MYRHLWRKVDGHLRPPSLRDLGEHQSTQARLLRDDRRGKLHRPTEGQSRGRQPDHRLYHQVGQRQQIQGRWSSQDRQFRSLPSIPVKLGFASLQFGLGNQYAIRLPEPPSTSRRTMLIVAPGSTGFMTGYKKKDSRLRSVPMVVMDWASCAEYLKTLNVDLERNVEYFCASTPFDSHSTSTVNTCEFLTGSPLVIADRLVGISTQIDGCRPYAPSVFFNVDSVNFWLRLKLKKEQPF